MIARQHPGEPQAEWYAEQLVEQLMASSPELFEQYTFRVVPNMNPDGTYFGNLRTNAKGNDLNRMWQSATQDNAPEVYHVLQKMQEIGVDLFLDIHSDEEIPEPFLDRAHFHCPEANEALEKQETDFMHFYMQYQSGMQNELNYGEADRTNPREMTIASVAVGQRFGCPAWTLEMPTKSGWMPEHCKALASDFFVVLEQFMALKNQATDELRAPGALGFKYGDNSNTTSAANLGCCTLS